MCTLKSNKQVQKGQSRIAKKDGVKNLSIKPAVVVSICAHCKTKHYVHQLSCRTCTQYLENQPQAIGAPRPGVPPALMAVACFALICMAGVCMWRVM